MPVYQFGFLYLRKHSVHLHLQILLKIFLKAPLISNNPNNKNAITPIAIGNL